MWLPAVICRNQNNDARKPEVEVMCNISKMKTVLMPNFSKLARSDFKVV